MDFERHIGTVMGSVIIALLLWVGSNLTTNIETTARTDVRLANIEEDVGDLKGTLNGRMSDRWRGSDQAKYSAIMDQRFNKLEIWQGEAEKRLDELALAIERRGTVSR